MTLQRPNQLKIVVPGDGPATEFWPRRQGDDRLRAGGEPGRGGAAPPTIEGALKLAFDRAAIYFPFTDLLLPDPYAAISPGAIQAFVVGPSAVVGGVKTDMLVWASNDVFVQVWIGSDDKLPRRIRA